MSICTHKCMNAHTHIYIYFTACGPLKHQRVMSGRRNQVFRRTFHEACVRNVSHVCMMLHINRVS